MKTTTQILVYTNEPKGSPLRVECKKCYARPGEPCKKWGKDIPQFHREREADFKTVREAEEKMAQWNKSYGKAV